MVRWQGFSRTTLPQEIIKASTLIISWLHCTALWEKSVSSWCRGHSTHHKGKPPHKPIVFIFSSFFCTFVLCCFTLAVSSTPSKSRKVRNLYSKYLISAYGLTSSNNVPLSSKLYLILFTKCVVCWEEQFNKVAVISHRLLARIFADICTPAWDLSYFHASIKYIEYVSAHPILKVVKMSLEA